MKRKPGFYWVLFFDRWQVAEYPCKNCWRIIANSGIFRDIDFAEINERRISK